MTSYTFDVTVVILIGNNSIEQTSFFFSEFEQTSLLAIGTVFFITFEKKKSKKKKQTNKQTDIDWHVD